MRASTSAEIGHTGWLSWQRSMRSVSLLQWQGPSRQHRKEREKPIPQRPVRKCCQSRRRDRLQHRTRYTARCFSYQQSSKSFSPQDNITGVMVQVGQEKREQLQAILLCSERGLTKMARKYPRLLQMEPADVLQRLLRLKAELPRCNVAHMVEVQPLLFLSRPTEDVAAQVSANYRLLARELPGMDVDTVVSERPAVLFIDVSKWPAGLAQIREMTSFPTDTTTLSNLLWALFGRSLEDRWDQVL